MKTLFFEYGNLLQFYMTFLKKKYLNNMYLLELFLYLLT